MSSPVPVVVNLLLASRLLVPTRVSCRSLLIGLLLGLVVARDVVLSGRGTLNLWKTGTRLGEVLLGTFMVKAPGLSVLH